MITVTKVTAFDGEDNHFTTKVSDKFPSYKDAVAFYKEELSNDDFKVKRVRMVFTEEEDK